MALRFTRLFLPAIFFVFLSSTAFAQTPTTCVVTAVPPIVYSEGLAERLGDIILKCTGTPGTAITTNLGVLLPVAITNRVDSIGFAEGAQITIDTGAGPVPSAISGLVTNQSITFAGLSFTFPPSGLVTLAIDDLRADVNQLGLVQRAPIQAYLSGSLALAPDVVTVAYPQQGLLATSMDSGVTCVGSPSPASVTLSNLFAAGTAEQTTRVTEGFPNAFQPKDATTDTGTRFLLSYSNFPTGAAIYVPDAVAGSGAAVPTSGGDLGTPAAVGQYTSGSHTLLLLRVLNADSTGAGGTLAALPAPSGSGALVLDGANPVTLTDGAGYAVYEVVDANPAAAETAQIPNFFAIAPGTPPAAASGGVSLAPVSTVTAASTDAPIPRFAAVQPPSDCSALGNCDASFYPLLEVTAQPMQVTAVAGGKRVGAGNITIKNAGGGLMGWSINIAYTNGANWIFLTQSVGINLAQVQVVVDPSALAPGTYQATLSIDAGMVAGSQTIPLNLTVNPAPAVPAVTINSVTNAADFHPGPVVAGSIATVWGTHLSGSNVTVTFNGIPATLFYTSAGQINLRIPPALSGASSAQVIVTADGLSSPPFTVQLTAVAPAIFTPGVLNQDNTVNSPAAPAPLGTVLQIFGTGMPDNGAGITVTLQNRVNLVPLYAGAAPDLPGLQQVNVMVPADLKPVTSDLIICATGPGNQSYCSQPESIALKP